MRTIKFRQAIFIQGKFNSFHFWGHSEREYFSSPQTNQQKWQENSMQFTGLTDKNGEEWYEGDICDEFMAIRWNDQNASFEFFWTYNDESCDGDINWCEAPDFLKDKEVLGNIYENQNLLK